MAGADERGAIAEQATALEEYLPLHGVQAPIQRHSPVPSRTLGDGLMSLAADVGADLLVMGRYGHPRARKLALGGASAHRVEVDAAAGSDGALKHDAGRRRLSPASGSVPIDDAVCAGALDVMQP